MAKKQQKPVLSSRKNIAVQTGASVLAVALIAAGVYWYVHRPLTLQQHLQRGEQYAKKGKTAMAMQEYAAAAALNKSDAAPYLAMSQLEESAGNLGTAADRLGTVLYYHPNYPHIQCRRAQLYGMANRYEMAFRIARDAVKIEPDCPAAHNDMGMLLEQCGDIQGAALELGKAHSLSPDDEALALDYARVLAKSGKPDDARNIVDSVLAVTRQYKVPANYLEGWILAEFYHGPPTGYVKALSAAQTFLGSALAENHNHTASLAESGRIFLQQGAYIAAQDQLEKAYKNGPDTIEMLNDLVQLYRAEKSSKLAEAVSTTNQMSQMLLPLKSYRRTWIKHPDDLNNTLKLAGSEMNAGNSLDAFDLIKEILTKDPNNEGAVELYNQLRSSQAPK